MNTSLTGSLPSFTPPQSPSRLTHLLLLENHFTGTIPTSFRSLTNLQYFFVGYNSLSGGIEVVANLTKLQRLSLNNNQFSQTLPSSLGQLTRLEYLYLNHNQFIGSIPDSFRAFVNLTYFAVSNNLLTGTLPASLSAWQAMITFVASDNSLTGTFPDFFAQWSTLTQLSLFSNRFSGSLPPNAFNNFPNLTLLLLQENHFSGDLQSNQLNAKNLTSLVSLDLSDNYFTSNLPQALLAPNSNLRVLVAFKQCFTDRIPTEICQLPHLQVLDLDGMTANCADQIWSGISNSPKYALNIDGGIPSCLWNMQNLTTLRLSGNGLTGTIPSSSHYGNLSEIDLSFNSLSGTIPTGLQQWTLLQLFNLENNKFHGDIEAMTLYHYQYSEMTDDYVNLYGRPPNNSTGIVLTLSQNRLSGSIPTALQSAQSIDILNGNLFTCSTDEPPPSHDPNSDNYVCGSDLLDYSLYFFLCEGVILITAIGLILLFLRFLQTFSEALSEEAKLVIQLRQSEAAITGGNGNETKITEFEMKEMNRDEETGNSNNTTNNNSSSSHHNSSNNRDSFTNNSQPTASQSWLSQVYSFYLFLLKINNHQEMKRIFHKYREVKLYYRNEEEAEEEELRQSSPQLQRTSLNDKDGQKKLNRISQKRGTTASDTSVETGSTTAFYKSSRYQRLKRSIVIIVLKLLMWRSKVTSTISRYEAEQQQIAAARMALSTASSTAELGSASVQSVLSLATTVKSKEIRYLYQFLKSLRTLRQISMVLMVVVVAVSSPTFFLLKESFGTYTSQYRWKISGAFLSGVSPGIFIIVLWTVSLGMTLYLLARNIPKFDESSTYLEENPPKEEEEAEADDENEEPEDNNHNNERTSSNEETNGHRTNSNNNSDSDHQERSISKIVFGRSLTFTSWTQSDSAKAFTNQLTSTVSLFKRYSLWLAIFSLTFNAVVVIVMKITFIFLLLSSDTTFTEKVLIELCLSGVDVIWGAVVLPYFVSNLPKMSSNTKMVLKTSMLYFNTILVPILIILVIDESCFYGVFAKSASVTESFSFESCLITPQTSTLSNINSYYSDQNDSLTSNTCFTTIQYSSETSYVPFFLYNYNCYSNVLVSYIPIFLISYLVLTIAIPSMTFFILSRHHSWRIMKLFPRLFFIETDNERALRYYHYRHRRLTSSASPASPMMTTTPTSTTTTTGKRDSQEDLMTMLKSLPSYQPSAPLPGLLSKSDSTRSIEEGGGGKRESYATGRSSYFEDPDQQFRPYSLDSLRPSYGAESMVIRSELHDTEIPTSFKFFRKVIFYPEFILAAAVHHILVMVTFGIMSPPLMIIAGLLTTVTSLVWETLLGRWMMRDETYLGDVIDEKFAGPYTTKLDELCIHVCRSPRKCLFLLCYGSGIFVGLMVLDMVGDAVGWYEAIWAPVVVMGIATLLFGYFNYYENIYADNSAFEGSSHKNRIYGRPTSSASNSSTRAQSGEDQRQRMSEYMTKNPILTAQESNHYRSKSADKPASSVSPSSSDRARKTQSLKVTLDQIKLVRQHREMLDEDDQTSSSSNQKKTRSLSPRPRSKKSINNNSPVRPGNRPLTADSKELGEIPPTTPTSPSQRKGPSTLQQLLKKIPVASSDPPLPPPTNHSNNNPTATTSDEPFLEMTSIYTPTPPKNV